MRDNNINTGLLRLQGEWRWADKAAMFAWDSRRIPEHLIRASPRSPRWGFGGFGSILLLCLHTFSVKTTSWQRFPSETSLVNQHVNIFPCLARKNVECLHAVIVVSLGHLCRLSSLRSADTQPDPIGSFYPNGSGTKRSMKWRQTGRGRRLGCIMEVIFSELSPFLSRCRTIMGGTVTGLKAGRSTGFKAALCSFSTVKW